MAGQAADMADFKSKMQGFGDDGDMAMIMGEYEDEILRLNRKLQEVQNEREAERLHNADILKLQRAQSEHKMNNIASEALLAAEGKASPLPPVGGAKTFSNDGSLAHKLVVLEEKVYKLKEKSHRRKAEVQHLRETLERSAQREQELSEFVDMLETRNSELELESEVQGHLSDFVRVDHTKREKRAERARAERRPSKPAGSSAGYSSSSTPLVSGGISSPNASSDRAAAVAAAQEAAWSQTSSLYSPSSSNAFRAQAPQASHTFDYGPHDAQFQPAGVQHDTFSRTQPMHSKSQSRSPSSLGRNTPVIQGFSSLHRIATPHKLDTSGRFSSGYTSSPGQSSPEDYYSPISEPSQSPYSSMNDALGGDYSPHTGASSLSGYSPVQAPVYNPNLGKAHPSSKDDSALFMSPAELDAMSVKEVKNLMKAMQLSTKNCVQKEDMIDKLIDHWTKI